VKPEWKKEQVQTTSGLATLCRRKVDFMCRWPLSRRKYRNICKYDRALESAKL